MARRLGMNSLAQPSGDGRQTVEQTIVNYQRPGELVLGDVATSPLELAGAYAAVANAGKFNAPAPIVSITDDKGKPVTVKRSPEVQAISPQVALQAVDILTGDTRFPGTSAAQFQPWYSQGMSTVAGKTGTSVAVVNGKDTTQNASLWFVGHDAEPGRDQRGHEPRPPQRTGERPAQYRQCRPPSAYGAYAAGVWLSALQPTLAGQHWAWTPPSAAPGSPVPPVVGLSVAQATQTLTGAGYKVAKLGNDPTDPLQCASTVPANMVAYAGPQIAPKGATITICPSSGIRQTVYTPPPPPKPKTTPGGGASRPGGGGGPTHTRGHGGFPPIPTPPGR